MLSVALRCVALLNCDRFRTAFAQVLQDPRLSLLETKRCWRVRVGWETGFPTTALCYYRAFSVLLRSFQCVVLLSQCGAFNARHYWESNCYLFHSILFLASV